MKNTISRRRLLSIGGLAFATSVAGCTGGDGGDGGGGDGGDGGDGGSGSGGGGGGGGGGGYGGGSGGSGGGSGGSGGGSTAADYPEFDPKDPQFPQLTSTLLEAGFETGTIADLERMRENPRDEPRYGNPVQETPDADSELLDPDTLQFAVVPTEDPALYRDTMQPLMDNMEAETGKSIKYNPLDSYAAQVEAMRSERLHVAGFSTGTVPFAVNLAGAVPFSIQVSSDGAFGYRLWLITQADNDEITELQALEGKKIAHSDPSSNSGNLAPRALFANQGIQPEEDYEVVYSGGHEQGSLGVAHGDYEAAPVCSTCFARVARAGQLDPTKIKCIWASNPFPTTGWSYRYNLAPEIQEGIRAAFLDYSYEDTAIAETFEGRGTWIEIDYATVWDIILQIQESLEVTYETGEMEG